MRFLRLFVEGIELPVESAAINTAVGSPAYATFTLPPALDIQSILPRSNVIAAVHYSFLPPDKWDEIKKAYDKYVSVDKVGNSDFEDYLIIFVGESMNLAVDKTVQSHSTTLTAISYTNWLDYIYNIMYTIDQYGTKTESMKRFFFGKSSASPDDVQEVSEKNCEEIVFSEKLDIPGYKKCAKAVAKMLDIQRALNSFEHMVKPQTVQASKLDKDENPITFGNATVDERTLFNKILELLYADALPEDCAEYKLGLIQKAEKFDNTIDIEEKRKALCWKSLIESSQELASDIKNFYASEAIDGFVKVLTDHLTKEGSFGHNLRNLLNAYLDDSALKTLAKFYYDFIARMSVSVASGNSDFFKAILSRDYAMKFFTNMLSASPKVFSLRTVLGYIFQILNMQMTEMPYPIMYFKGDKVNTHFQFFVKPETIFNAVPTCNVVFPEEYNLYNMAYNPGAEPTRGYYRTTTFFGVGQNMDSSVGQMLSIEHIVPDSLQDGAVITPEELIRGPVYTQKDFNFYIIDSLAFAQGGKRKKDDKVPVTGTTQRGASTDEGGIYAFKNLIKNNSTKPKSDKKSLDDVLASLSVYSFLKQKTSQRSFTLSVTFNPFILIGEPILVAYYLDDGTHIVGYTAGVSHVITQNNASTTISIQYGRGFKETAVTTRKGSITYFEVGSYNKFAKFTSSKAYFSDLYWGSAPTNIFTGTKYIPTASAAAQYVIKIKREIEKGRKIRAYSHNEDILATKFIPVPRLSDVALLSPMIGKLFSDPVTLDKEITFKSTDLDAYKTASQWLQKKTPLSTALHKVSELKRTKAKIYRFRVEYNKIKGE